MAHRTVKLYMQCTLFSFFFYNPHRYYNAWLETYTEEEYKRHADSSTSLDGEKGSQSSESESENEQLEDDLSLEFQNDTSSDDSSESELSDMESDSFHSAEEDLNLREEEDDSFITFESPSSVYVTSPRIVFDREESKEEDSDFMHNFSDGSNDGSNILGKLETQVMNLSIPRFRIKKF